MIKPNATAQRREARLTARSLIPLRNEVAAIAAAPEPLRRLGPNRGISFHAVGKRYREDVALQDVTFEVPAGRATALIGPNGAGKTTVIKLILGLIAPTTGSVLVDGLPAHHGTSRARLVGAATDVLGLDPDVSARTLVHGLCGLLGVSRDHGDHVLERVGGAAFAGKRIGTLSMGMAQRVRLAVALLPGAPYLVLDEPQTGLDPDGIAWLYALVREEVAAGRSVLIATHHLDEADVVSQHCIVLNRTVRYVGPAHAGLASLYEAVR